MLVSGEKRTVAMIATLLLVALLFGTQGVRAMPFGQALKSETRTLVVHVDKIRPDYFTGWQNVGNPYYFENCWWQHQQYFANGRPIRDAVRNKKNSCPGLSYGAESIRRPVPSLSSRPHVIGR